MISKELLYPSIGIIVFLNLLVGAIVYGLYLPIAVFIQVKNNKEMSIKKKILWYSLLASMWTFAGIIYGLMSSKDKVTVIASRAFFPLIILQVILIGIFIKCNSNLIPLPIG